jgi:inosine-uridine nucleoside N-ribohydrolase
MTRRNIILDVDTGTDDAIAIMIAALHADINLVACTTVNGNVAVEHSTQNTLRVLDLIGRGDVPVYAGLSRPLVRWDTPTPRKTSAILNQVHGTILPLPPTRLEKADATAVDFLIETYRNATDEIVLVPVAPMTNIATALALFPKLVDLVPEVVIMGGGHAVANITASAEFNVWADPEAAAIVLGAGFRKLTLVPLDATHAARISENDCARLRESGTPAALAAADLIGRRIDAHRDGTTRECAAAPVHDALVVASIIDGSILTFRQAHVAVETFGARTIGRTVIDMRDRGAEAPNARVAIGANEQAFAELLVSTLAASPVSRRAT